MEKEQLENVLKDVVSFCADENGWANLAKVGFQLRKRSINTKAMGYKKLSSVFNAFENVFEIKSDLTIEPPVAYTRIKVDSTVPHKKLQ